MYRHKLQRRVIDELQERTIDRCGPTDMKQKHDKTSGEPTIGWRVASADSRIADATRMSLNVIVILWALNLNFNMQMARTSTDVSSAVHRITTVFCDHRPSTGGPRILVGGSPMDQLVYVSRLVPEDLIDDCPMIHALSLRFAYEVADVPKRSSVYWKG
ncbi:hypothetical protein HAX54_033498 [Datura stramonium]|uniref:Uncharacterized protein n=1 Tax=Datura stramonium TaxID=4076 RepID=A0ABS8VET0_DATST|nr:hypothetical protein [Datura stramonium]